MIVNISAMEDGQPGDSLSEGDSDDSSSESEENSQEEDEHIFNDESDESLTGDEEAVNEDGEEDDELITKIEDRKEIVKTKPSPIIGEDLFTDLSLSPSDNIIALSSISGNVLIYLYGIDNNELAGTIEAHIKSCRAVEFSPDGKTLYSIGKDKNIVFSDLEKMDMKMFIDSAHHVALTALCVPEENTLITGDEEGVIKIWDPRYAQSAVFKAHDAQDYITSMASKETYKVACSSSDGTITSYDLRAHKKLQQSPPFETDINCCASTHNDTMLVCGTMINQFLFYKWNDFSDIAGTFKPSQESLVIDSLLPVSDNIVLCGTEKGHIKAFHFFPHKEIGIVGQHTLTVERLDVSHDGSLVASLSSDPIVKFWDISYLEGLKVDEVEKPKTKSGINLPSSEFDDRKTFFSDLS